MALSINLVTSQFGVPFTGAYFRIATASITRTRDPLNRFSVMIDVAGYATEPLTEDTRDVDFRRYHAPLSQIITLAGAGFMSQCYAWVATQSDMAGAVAC